jgi:integral membrane protein (TIGR01906 family)
LNRLLPRMIQWAVALALPALLLVVNLRIVTGHWLVRWEYGKAGFPDDPYGLTVEERSRLAIVCVDYLATSADISLLAELLLLGGDPAFNERELQHMDDVQKVYDALTVAGVIAGVVVAGGIVTLWTLAGARQRVPAALLGGSLITLGLLIGIGVYMALNWDQFFTNFHRVFFEGDSWLFLHSDTLIRLFPMRFWMDVAAALVGLLVLEAVILGAGGWQWSRYLR